MLNSGPERPSRNAGGDGGMQTERADHGNDELAHTEGVRFTDRCIGQIGG